ncbi:efflux RND transporter periplasmic adaptor subunit [Propylenella binzhouense]|uniref:Efflux RND transporter periplasmic adaptor subunit n=1 Tax=Propylenella binzhouense TaxID=2555902 RepID=A0A964WS29_9HYPH|nr:efflux RND transporter periplasmic adaptor subunit [Propylenella binzhouense]MYZ46534.1 efflux RND transporter periplasmic adaptor subunit [Propylenella binzhouense]
MPRTIRSVAALALAAAGLFPWAPPVGAAERAVETLTIPELKAVFGQIESRTVVPARARIGGTLTEVLVGEGSEVEEGEVIARVVDDKIALELDAANARIKALDSQLENARVELDRAQELLARGVAPQSRVDQATTAFDVVSNQVAAANAEKAVIEQRAREGDILAPETGRVLSVPVTRGSVILAGEEIARIASGRYYLRLSLPERHAAEIVEGASVTIGRRGISGASAGSDEDTRSGRIAKVYPEIADGRVIADVEVADIGDYFVGERTLVRIPVGRRTVLAVPAAALTTRHGIDYVRVASPDGALDVAVILGETFAHEGERMVEILTGLSPGDRVVVP